ncbi:hypothetical protein L596_027477 [Steinernema carpocapsae]|uniref:Uncharacterized protein n=1 Tax=Steinernema carpocapsae TaxID=34508 RepID=A0A4U5LVK8_STECR|nr:hypothetical protein L596_027477 [Steinernema carpocapsae]
MVKESTFCRRLAARRRPASEVLFRVSRVPHIRFPSTQDVVDYPRPEQAVCRREYYNWCPELGTEELRRTAPDFFFVRLIASIAANYCVLSVLSVNQRFNDLAPSRSTISRPALTRFRLFVQCFRDPAPHHRSAIPQASRKNDTSGRQSVLTRKVNALPLKINVVLFAFLTVTLQKQCFQIKKYRGKPKSFFCEAVVLS